MLRTVSGDLLLSGAQVIAHGVAPNDHFDQGLALSLRQEYPAMVKDFRHYCNQQHPKPGSLWVWPSADGKRIVNLLTQEPAPDKRAHPGKATTQNVSKALRSFRNLIEDEAFTSIALPRLATGVGGLQWNAVSELIDQHLGDLDIPIFVYTEFHAGVKAAE